MDHLQLLAYAEREEAREAKRTAAAGISVMRAELDAATSSSADVHEVQWRAGVNRQAQPTAAEHQQQQAVRGGIARQALPDRRVPYSTFS